MHCWAPTRTIRPSSHDGASVGKQTIEDTGPLTKKRMETIDDESREAARDFIDAAERGRTSRSSSGNSTHMHFRTHVKPESSGRPGRGSRRITTTMIEHDNTSARCWIARRPGHRGQHHRHVLHRQRPAHEHLAGRRHDAVPQREEHQLGGRLPRAGIVRWPGKIKAGVVSNEIVSHHDWLPTLLAAAGEPDIKEKLLKGHQVGDRTFKVHLDGYNLLPYLTGEEEEEPAPGFFYFTDDGDLVAVRFDNWKFVFMEQRAAGRCGSGPSPSAAARPEDLQPADRPLRARGHHLEHLLRLADRPRLPRSLPHRHRAGSSKRSRSSPRGKRHPASASTRPTRRCCRLVATRTRAPKDRGRSTAPNPRFAALRER